MKRLFIIYILMLSTSVSAQFSDHFHDGDYTNNPTWSGTTEKFIVNSNHALQIRDNISNHFPQIAYLSTPSNAVSNAIWQCTITFNCSLEQSNYIRFYIISNTSKLNEPLNGYFILVGTEQGNIQLCQQSGLNTTTLIQGTPHRLTNGMNTIQLLCTRAQNGIWQLYSQTESDNYPLLEGSITQTNTPDAKYSGILFSYSQECNEQMSADNFIVTGNSDTPTNPDINTSNNTNRHAIVFTELMVDPTPTVSLPDCEYVEIYNRTDSTISLENWKLYGNNSAGNIASGVIEPKGYALLCTASAQTLLQPYGNTIVVTSFPALTNSGKLLYLESNNKEVISWINYSDCWYKSEPFKKEGGWAFERIDVDNLNNNQENWTLSTDHSGGTPGRANSEETIFPDTVMPEVCYFALQADSACIIYFNKEMNPDNLVDNAIQTSPTLSLQKSYLEPCRNTLKLQFNSPISDSNITEVSLNGLYCISNLMLPDTTLQLIIPQTPQPSDIVINELLFNPKTEGVKFIEFFNRSNHYLSLQKLALTTQTENGTLAAGNYITEEEILLAPQQFLLVTTNLNTLYNQYLCKKIGVHLECKLPSMPIAGGNIVLASAKGTIIDALTYSEQMHHPLISNSKGVSLERVNPDLPSEQNSSWQSAAAHCNYATPGYRNSQYFNNALEVSSKHFWLSSEQFSPNNDGYNDLLALHYQLPEDGYLINIQIFTPNGIKVTNLTNNTIAGTEGTLFWDGTNASGTLSPVGIYVLFIEATHPNGPIIRAKEIAVLTSN